MVLGSGGPFFQVVSLSFSLSLVCSLFVLMFGSLEDLFYILDMTYHHVCGDIIIYSSIFGSDAPKHQPFSNCVLDCRTLPCNFFKIELFVIIC